MTSRRRRPGFTLIELLVTTVLLAVVGGAVMAMLARQQRFYRGTSDIVDLRSQLRQGAFTIASDLRGISSAGSDLVAMTDSSVDFRFVIGSSIVCKMTNTSTFIIPPLTLVNNNTLTTWLEKPGAGDTAFIFSEADSTIATDDTWPAYGLGASSVATNTGGCNALYTQAGDNSSDSYNLSPASGTFCAALSASNTLCGTIKRGAAIRFERRAHYSLHQFSDGQWYLGYCVRSCSGSDAISPIAGPFLSYVTSAGSGTSGIRFTAYDSTGATVALAATPAITPTTATSSKNVARISLVLRGQAKNLVNIEGLKKGTYVDSVRIDVALRNRS